MCEKMWVEGDITVPDYCLFSYKENKYGLARRRRMTRKGEIVAWKVNYNMETRRVEQRHPRVRIQVSSMTDMPFVWVDVSEGFVGNLAGNRFQTLLHQSTSSPRGHVHNPNEKFTGGNDKKSKDMCNRLFVNCLEFFGKGKVLVLDGQELRTSREILQRLPTMSIVVPNPFAYESILLKPTPLNVTVLDSTVEDYVSALPEDASFTGVWLDFCSVFNKDKEKLLEKLVPRVEKCLAITWSTRRRGGDRIMDVFERLGVKVLNKTTYRGMGFVVGVVL